MKQKTECPGCGALTTEKVKQIDGYDLVRCGACSLVFVPSDQLAAVNYDKLYEADGHYKAHVQEARELVEGKRPIFSRARRRALQFIRDMSPTNLLEVGCGVGNFLSWIEAFGIKCAGIDVSTEAISLAQSHLGCPLHVGELTASALEGQRFAVVCAWEVLEHISDTENFLRQLHERLHSGGTLFMSTPNYQSSWMWRDVDADPRGVPPIHVTFWNEYSARRALQRCGFEDVDIQVCSIPLNAARRSGRRILHYMVVPDALLRRGQRRTLLIRARKEH